MRGQFNTCGDKDIQIIAAEKKVKEREYWLKTLTGIPAPAVFPLDHKETGAGQYRTEKPGTGMEILTFSSKLSTMMIKLSNQSLTRLHIILAAGLAALLHRYTQSNDITMGTPVLRQEAESNFLNTVLPLRIQIEEGMSFKQLLLDVRETVNRATENQNYPMDILIEQLGIDDTGNQFPLFGTALLLENIHEKKYIQHTHPGMLFSFKKNGEQVEAVVEYSLFSYEPGTIKRIEIHFTHLLRRALLNVDEKVDRISILPEEEKRQILFYFNDTVKEYPQNKTVPGLFREQVNKKPDAIALVFEDKWVTYKTLDTYVGRLAAYLRREGVKGETVIPVLMDWSVELIIGIMGVLESGGAYLPLDSDYPEERIKTILKDCRSPLAVTSHSLLPLFRGLSTAVIELERCCGCEEVFESGDGKPSPHDPAYVVYTSGSTGNPRGIVVEHRCFVDFCTWAVEEFEHKPGYRALLSNSFASDGAIQQVFPPLISGGTLHLLHPGVRLDIPAYLAYLKDRKINNIDEVPVLMNLMFDHIHLDENSEFLPDLTCLSLGSEYVPIEVVRKCRKYLNHNGRIINAYGPAETSVETTTYHFDGSSAEEKSLIGKPRRNLNVYILDPREGLCPIGLPGEICIGGTGVARGYINQPGSTAQRFIKNLHPDIPLPVLYKTGDKGCWMPDGNIEFLGRLDYQVMVRGHRVELAEIEKTLLEHPVITDSVVTAREDETGTFYLSAYIVANKKLLKAELRTFLSKKLSRYMIPAHFILLDRLPLNPNGKVDRKVLPAPAGDSEEDYEEPANEIEQKLVHLWQEVLGVDRIGVYNNFFQMGGDSIKAIRVSSKLLKERLKLVVRDLFLYPTIRELGKYIRQIDRPADQGVVKGEIKLTPIQKWFFENHTVHLHHFNQAVILHRQSGFKEGLVKEVFTRIVAHHDALRMMYKVNRQGHEKVIVVQWNRGIEGKLFEFEITDFKDRTMSEAEIKKEIERAASRIQGSINLSTGPLVKLGLFKTGKGDFLLIVIHHLVVDGISWRILFEDAAVGYRQALGGKEIRFQEKTDSFKHWAEMLSHDSVIKKVLKERDYWKAIEKTDFQPLPRDTDVDIERKKFKNFSTLSIQLGKETTRELLYEANRAYNTEVNDILLTALGMAVNHWSGFEKVVILLEGHGRESMIEDININRTVGWFTSEFPVVLDMSGAKDLSCYIKLVKETLRRIPNRGIGYGVLKYLAAKDKCEDFGFKFTLEPEISFNYLGQFDGENEIGSGDELFTISNLKVGELISPEFEKNIALDIVGIVAEGQLTLSFSYNIFQYRSSRIEEVADAYKKNLLKIIDHCRGKDETELTPSDFTRQDLDMKELEAISEIVAEI